MSRTNRFYRPSASQYTSQFIQDPFPYQQLTDLSKVKVQRAEGLADQAGKVESAIALMTAGYRTEDITPAVKSHWDQRINAWMDKNAGRYDMNAIRELSALRNEFIGDPNVKLIQQDFASGNKEYDALRKSKTFNLDVNPNVDPNTGRIKQFSLARDIEGAEGIQSGQTYQPYDQLTYFSNFERPIDQQLAIVDYERKSVPFSSGVVGSGSGAYQMLSRQGYVDYKDEGTFAPAIKEMAEDIVEGRMDYSAYMKATWDGGDWNKENIEDYLRDRSVKFYKEKEDIRTSSRGLTKSELDSFSKSGDTHRLESHQRHDLVDVDIKAYDPNRIAEGQFRGMEEESHDSSGNFILNPDDPFNTAKTPGILGARNEAQKQYLFLNYPDSYNKMIEYFDEGIASAKKDLLEETKKGVLNRKSNKWGIGGPPEETPIETKERLEKQKQNIVDLYKKTIDKFGTDKTIEKYRDIVKMVDLLSGTEYSDMDFSDFATNAEINQAVQDYAKEQQERMQQYPIRKISGDEQKDANEAYGGPWVKDGIVKSDKASASSILLGSPTFKLSEPGVNIDADEKQDLLVNDGTFNITAEVVNHPSAGPGTNRVLNTGKETYIVRGSEEEVEPYRIEFGLNDYNNTLSKHGRYFGINNRKRYSGTNSYYNVTDAYTLEENRWNSNTRWFNQVMKVEKDDDGNMSAYWEIREYEDGNPYLTPEGKEPKYKKVDIPGWDGLDPLLEPQFDDWWIRQPVKGN